MNWSMKTPSWNTGCKDERGLPWFSGVGRLWNAGRRDTRDITRSMLTLSGTLSDRIDGAQNLELFHHVSGTVFMPLPYNKV